MKKIRFVFLLLLISLLSSCAGTMWACRRLQGIECPMVCDFPFAQVHVEINSSRTCCLQNARFTVLSNQADRISDEICMRFKVALEGNGYRLSQLENASHIILLSYSEGSLKAEITHCQQSIWEGFAHFMDFVPFRSCLNWEEEKESLLHAYKSKTFYGDYHFLMVDYLITALINNLGSKTSTTQDIHPRQFRLKEKN